jgi:hypothetical protein
MPRYPTTLPKAVDRLPAELSATGANFEIHFESLGHFQTRERSCKCSMRIRHGSHRLELLTPHHGTSARV